MKKIEEKLKDIKTKMDIAELIRESAKEYSNSGKPFHLLEFSHFFCINAVERYGLLANLILDYWGIRNLRDMAYILREFARETKRENKIKFEIPAYPPEDFFARVLNRKNIYLSCSQTNGHVNIEYILGNNIK